MSKSLITALSVAFLAASSPSTLSAQSVDASDAEARTTAEKTFRQGAEFYAAGEYAKAIVEFLIAYNAVPNPMFLYNISLSYQKLGNADEALSAARRARADTGLDATTSLRNDARIVALEVHVATAANAEAIATRPAPPTVVERKRPTASSRDFGLVGWTGAAMVVTGGVLATGALLVANGMRSDLNAYKEAGTKGDRVTYNRLRSDLEGDQKLGKALLFSGGGVAAAGLVLVLIDAFTGSDRQTTTSVLIRPLADGAAVGVQTRF